MLHFWEEAITASAKLATLSFLPLIGINEYQKIISGIDKMLTQGYSWDLFPSSWKAQKFSLAHGITSQH